jgi:hypothetical protein
MRLGPGGLFRRACVWEADGLRGRPCWLLGGPLGLDPLGVMGRLPAGDIERGGPLFMAGDIGRPWPLAGDIGRFCMLAGDIGRPCGGTRMPGGGGPLAAGEPFCCGRGLTGRVDRQVLGTTPC